MGDDIKNTTFTRADFQAFSTRLKAETELLKRWWTEGKLATEPSRIGLELELWLVDADGRPKPCNAEVLAQAKEPQLAPELAQYNLEFNSTPQPLAGRSFTALRQELERAWHDIGAAAALQD